MSLSAKKLATNIAAGFSGQHSVVFIASKPTVQTVRALAEFAESHLLGRREKFVYYGIWAQGVAVPDEETRLQIRAIGERFRERVVCVSMVIEMPGFGGAALRSLVTGVSILLGNLSLVRAHSDTDGAALWAMEKLKSNPALQPLTAAELRAARDELERLAK